MAASDRGVRGVVVGELESIAGFAEALRRAEVTGWSTRRLVSVHRGADRRVQGQISPGTIARLRTAAAPAAEIRSALVAALRDYERQYFAARWRWFGSRLGDRTHNKTSDSTAASTGERRLDGPVGQPAFPHPYRRDPHRQGPPVRQDWSDRQDPHRWRDGQG